MVQAALEISSSDPAFEMWRQRFLTLYEAGLGQLSDPYPGLTTLIARLHQMDVRWGVVTNKLERFARPLMALMPFTLLPKRSLLQIMSPCRNLTLSLCCSPADKCLRAIGDTFYW